MADTARYVVLPHPQDCPVGLNRRALLFFDEGRYEEAQRDLEHCVKIAPFFTDAIHNLGLCYHESQKLDCALRMYGRAILIEGDCVSLNNRGLLFNDMKENAKAIAGMGGRKRVYFVFLSESCMLL